MYRRSFFQASFFAKQCRHLSSKKSASAGLNVFNSFLEQSAEIQPHAGKILAVSFVKKQRFSTSVAPNVLALADEQEQKLLNHLDHLMKTQFDAPFMMNLHTKISDLMREATTTSETVKFYYWLPKDIFKLFKGYLECLEVKYGKKVEYEEFSSWHINCSEIQGTIKPNA
ncbi:hypothetical protein L596_016319 [Steinernema carpocapsae]|uniref:Uncharacterized protein n=1 Tax=Steinernema carpocapsae TaxID=34508 RepID=A0A4U5NHR8_STECR|nr:hypothetical protein L596_016319 [Steinernema carpocapsae]